MPEAAALFSDIVLGPTQKRVLRVLTQRVNKIVSFEDFHEAGIFRADVREIRNTLHAHVSEIRRAVKKAGREITIKAVYGTGYILLVPQ